MTSLDLRFLTEEERHEFDSLVQGYVPPIWSPLPGPQSMAYENTANVIGYGGAAGGGKTDLALGKALRKHRRALIVRRLGTEHTAFLDRLEELLGSREGYNGKDGIWRIEDARCSPHRVQIELGSVPNAGDERKYRGRPHDLKVFDEASEIPEEQVRFLLGWLRTTVPGQACQALLCFNPPTTAEGRWIIKYFGPWLDPKHPHPAQPGELRWYASIDGKEVEVGNGVPFKHNAEVIRPQSRTFVPARVTDNPYLTGTHYMTQLQALPEPLRSQMLYGDFRAGVQDDPWQVIPTAWVEAAMARWKLPDVLPEMESIGVDVARGGKDATVIACRHGRWFNKPLKYPGSQTPDGPAVAGLVIAAMRDKSPIHIDAIGVGASPYDFLMQANQQVIAVIGSEAANGTDQSGRMRFKNRRSMDWWRMREALDPANNRGIALPPDSELLADLCAPIWKPQGPIIYVESREDIVKRIGRSPDMGTAVILANMDTPKFDIIEQFARSHGAAQSGSGMREYDPYGDKGKGMRF